jgi:hypothetical protein
VILKVLVTRSEAVTFFSTELVAVTLLEVDPELLVAWDPKHAKEHRRFAACYLCLGHGQGAPTFT